MSAIYIHRYSKYIYIYISIYIYIYGYIIMSIILPHQNVVGTPGGE